MSNQCQVRHASLACKGWGAPSPDLSSAWHSVWSPWVPTVLLFTTSDGHFTQIYINYFWLFEVGVSLLILQKSLGRACDTSHNSDWQMLFSSIRRADEFSQGWLRQISQLYASSCREIGGQEFTSEKRSSVHGPGRNSDIAGVFESGLAMQTQLADVAPARPAADINAAQKKKRVVSRDVSLWSSQGNYAVSKRPGRPPRRGSTPGGSFCWECRVFPVGSGGWQLHTCLLRSFPSASPDGSVCWRWPTLLPAVSWALWLLSGEGTVCETWHRFISLKGSRQHSG